MTALPATSPSSSAAAGDARFRAIFDQAPIGMLLMNSERIITKANAASCHILRRAAEDMVGRSSSELSLPEDVAIGLDLYARMMDGKLDGYRVEKRLLRADGSPVWVELTVSRVEGGAEDEIVIAQIQDVTRRKAAEVALAASARELERHAADLERSNAELEQFAYVASHDLSEPLRTISGFMTLLRDRYGDALDEDAGTFIEFAVSGTQRMQQMIDDLLLYSRAGRADMELEPVELGELGELVVAGLAEAIRDAGAEVEVRPLPRVLGNRGQLVQLLQNLVANALKFVPADAVPRVTIHSEQRDLETVVIVEDEGIGIPPGSGERIFKMFQRLHEREAYSGTGIGLAICRKIVERHRGRMWHEAAEGGGSRFCFTLRTAPREDDPGPEHPAPALREASEQRRTTPA